MQPEEPSAEPRASVPSSPTGRVPAWVQEEAFRAQVSGTRPNYGPFTDTPPPGGPPGWVGGTSEPAGRFSGFGPAEPPRRSLGARLAVVGVAFALALAAVVVGADYLRTVRVPPELLGSYAEREDLPPPLAIGANAGRPRAGFGEQDSPLASPPEVTEPSDAWEYRSTVEVGGDERPVLWSPCRPIHYVVNTDGAPEDFLLRVVDVVAEVSAATGLVFTYDGTTTEPVSDGRPAYLPRLYGDRWAPVLIGWADDETIGNLAGDVAGLALTHAEWDRKGSAVFSVSGQVILDTDLRSYPRPDTYVGVLRHELAHLAGLGHVEDESQIMHARSSIDTFQRGDLTGLAAVGAGACSPLV